MGAERSSERLSKDVTPEEDPWEEVTDLSDYETPTKAEDQTPATVEVPVQQTSPSTSSLPEGVSLWRGLRIKRFG